MKSTFSTNLAFYLALGACVLAMRDEFVLLLIPEPKFEEKPIGTIASSIRDVRIRFRNDLLWLPAKRGQNVYNGTMLFTGTNSEAKVGLENDTELTVRPNSLLQLQRVGDARMVKLEQGEVDAVSPSGERMKIQQTEELEFIPVQLTAKPTKIPAMAPKSDYQALLAHRRKTISGFAPVSALPPVMGGPEQDSAGGASSQDPTTNKTAAGQGSKKKSKQSEKNAQPTTTDVGDFWVIGAIYAIMVLFSIFDVWLQKPKNGSS